MQRIKELEGLRSFLALWVLVSHTLPAAGIYDYDKALGPFSFLADGGDAVDIFIIMSGFLIFYLLENAREPYGQFIIRRFLRLYPVYIVCLIISILLINFYLKALHSLPWEHPTNTFLIQVFSDSLKYFIPQFAAHLTMLHGTLPDFVLPSSSSAFIAQAWSISTEWQFYLVSPLLFHAAYRKNLVIKVFLGGVVSVLYFLFKDAEQGFFLIHLPFFLVGIVSFFIWNNYYKIVLIPKQQWVLVMPIGVTITLLVIHKISLTLWALVFLSILALKKNNNLILENFICSLLNNRVMLYLGRISYSIYLCHTIFVYSFMYYLGQLFPKLDRMSYFGLLLLLVVPVTIIFSHLLYHWLEKPFIQFGKRLFAKKP